MNIYFRCRSKLLFTVVCATIIVTLALFMIQGPQKAFSAPTPPPYTVSYYMNTVDPDVYYDMGYDVGRADYNTPGTQDSIIILDFGGQNSAGTGATLRWNPDATYEEIKDAVVDFARGYFYGTGSDFDSTIRIIVGTNNSAYQVDFDGGVAWAEMVNDIDAEVEERGYDSQVRISGGSDMELDWADPEDTREWCEGYDSEAVGFYYNYGDAAGCTTSTTYDGEEDYPCDNGWMISDIFYISWEVPSAYALPQIYFDSMARQWKNIKKYGVVSEDNPMYIRGSLTQEGACAIRPDDPNCDGTNSPDEGWQQLYDRLNSDEDTEQSLRYSTDITWHE